MLPEFLKEITVTTENTLVANAQAHNLMRPGGFHMSMTGLCVRKALLEWCASHPGHAPMPVEEIDEIVTLKSQKERDPRALGLFKSGNRIQNQLQREFALRKLLYAGRDSNDKVLRCTYNHFEHMILPLDFHKYPELLLVHGEADLLVGNNENPYDLAAGPPILIECKSTSRKDADRMDGLLLNEEGGQTVPAKNHHALQTTMYLYCLKHEINPIAWICYWCREDDRKYWAEICMSNSALWMQAIAWWEHTFNALNQLMKAQTLKWVGGEYPLLSVQGCHKESWECRWGKSGKDTCDFYNFCYHTKGGSSGKRKGDDFGAAELDSAFGAK